MRSDLQVDVVDGSDGSPGASDLGGTLDIGELVRVDGQAIVAARVEVLEELDPVEHVCDELLQEESRCNARASAQLAPNRPGQVPDVGIVYNRVDPVGILGTSSEDVADPGSEFHERSSIETGQPD